MSYNNYKQKLSKYPENLVLLLPLVKYLKWCYFPCLLKRLNVISPSWSTPLGYIIPCPLRSQIKKPVFIFHPDIFLSLSTMRLTLHNTARYHHLPELCNDTKTFFKNFCTIFAIKYITDNKNIVALE